MAVTTSSGNGFALYNGVKLPNVESAWDKTKYPYALIARFDETIVYFSTKPFYVDTNADLCLTEVGTMCSYVNDTGWQDPETITGYPANEPIFNTDGDAIVWTSHDIPNADNSVYLAASAPISLDGMTVIEWDGDTTGLPNVNLGATYYRIADYAFATSGFCYAQATDDALDDTTGEIFSSEGPIWTIANNESGPLCIAVPEEAKDELGFEQGGIYVFFLPDGAYVSVLAYSADTPSEPTYDRTAFLSGLAMGLCGKGNPTFEGSGKMLYSGVELPKLPEWDKTAYPYAILVEHNAAIPYWLAVSTVAFRNVLGASIVKGTCYVFPLEKDGWGEMELFTGLSVPLPIWTNTDFLNQDGSVYLAASKPVPVEDAFTKGYHVGAELRAKRRLPVAYLYNGVRLPKLPEWDKTKYPYAVIVPHGGVVGKPYTMYRLYLVDSPFTEVANFTDAIPANADRIMYYAFDSNTAEPPSAFPMADRGKWEYEASGTVDYTVSLDRAVWTNTDIHKKNLAGVVSVSLAASDPVPVYE